jgi:hypothetical protein
MQPQTKKATAAKQRQSGEEKIKQLRDLFAEAPELGKTALENVLRELSSQVSEPPPPIESAGRVGARLGKRSELTIVPPIARRQPLARCDQGWHAPRHALRVFRQRHENAFRHFFRRRLGRLYRRLHRVNPRLSGHHRLCVGRLARDSQSRREGVPHQAPDNG